MGQIEDAFTILYNSVIFTFDRKLSTLRKQHMHCAQLSKRVSSCSRIDAKHMLQIKSTNDFDKTNKILTITLLF